MRLERLAQFVAFVLSAGLATNAAAIAIGVEQVIGLGTAPDDVPADAEGIAVIPTGPNAGIYIPGDTAALGTVTVLDVATGAFLYRFQTGIGTELRSIDVLPNGNLIIGQHDVNVVREVIIPPNPGNGTTPTASLGTISFELPSHTSPVQAFDEFESITAFERPSDGAVFLLFGEEGRTKTGAGSESPAEIYMAQVSGAGITGFSKLFEVPLTDNFDDISGMDIINVAFDGSGNVDLAASRIIASDDSSGGDSTAYVLNLLGQILETLDGPGSTTIVNFEDLFDPDGAGPDVGPAWRDAEGVDYQALTDTTGIASFFFSTGASGTPQIVRIPITFEAPPVPEPATVLLLALPLVLLALRRSV